MNKKSLLLLLFVMLPHSVFAGSIITWEAFGSITRAVSYFGPGPIPAFPNGIPQSPPVGTPYAIVLMFDPDARVTTPFAPAGSPCFTTSATGSLNLGGANYGLVGGVYTNSFLPGNNCGSSPYPPGALEFFLVTTVGPDPFNLNLGPRFLDLLYFDMLHTDGTFPTTPTIGPPVNALLFKHDFFEFGGSFLPQAAAVEQPAPVPEPGTLGLVGIGLALAARRRRRSNASRVR